MRAWLAAATVGLLVVACDGPTAPRGQESVQRGFGDPGQRRYGLPRLIVSTDIAVGRTIDPKVLSPILDSATARAAARFKSTRGDVIGVAADGRLAAKQLGQAEVIVNLDGEYDTVAVNVIEGFTYTVHPWPSGATFAGFNVTGDLLGFRGWWDAAEATIVRAGAETRIPGCHPAGFNVHRDVLCRPGARLYRDGVMTNLLPDGFGGLGGDINDAGQVVGGFWTSGGVDGWFTGLPGNLVMGELYGSTGGRQINAAGIAVVSESSVDVYSADPHYRIEEGDTTKIGTGFQFLNDRGDLLAAPDGGSRLEFPYQTLIWLQGEGGWKTSSSDWRCHAAMITNQRRMVGTGPEGWCLVDLGGRYTIVKHATTVSGPAGWNIHWGTDAWTQAFMSSGRRYHATGIMALPATNAAGDTAVVLLRTDPPE